MFFKKIITIVLLFSFSVYAAQDSLYVHVTGISSISEFGTEVDSSNAVISAKRKALEKAGIDTEDKKDSYILDMSEEVLFPNYKLTNQRYIGDNTYQVILEGYVKKEYKSNKPKTIFIVLAVGAVIGITYLVYKNSIDSFSIGL
jgi:hypothetical protein